MTKAALTSTHLRTGRVQYLDPAPQVGEACEPVDLCKRCEKAAASDEYADVAMAEIEAPTGKVHYELDAGSTLCGLDSSGW
jgi:hypothetical protein